MRQPSRPSRPAEPLALGPRLILACWGPAPPAPRHNRLPARPPQPAAPIAPAAKREPANVMSWEKAAWLERDGRAENEKPELVIEAMALREGMTVAEIGAGTGFFTRRLAKAVGPTGKVLAEEIQPQMLDLLKQNAAKEGIAQHHHHPRHRDRPQAPAARRRPPPAGRRLPRVPEAGADARQAPRVPGARRHRDPGRVPPRRGDRRPHQHQAPDVRRAGALGMERRGVRAGRTGSRPSPRSTSSSSRPAVASAPSAMTRRAGRQAAGIARTGKAAYLILIT